VRPRSGAVLTAGIAEIGSRLWRERMRPDRLAPTLVIACAFTVLFYRPFLTLVRDWWSLPEAGHGLLLFPVALWLLWRDGLDRRSVPHAWFGAIVLVFAIVLRFASELAAEQFTMRLSMVIALVGLVVFFYGVRQAVSWWLPLTLAILSIPLPELVTQTLALPLQFKASQMGAALLEARHVPVQLSGNIIRIPGHELFVTEACSGLRSLTALVSMAILVGAVILRTPLARVVLLALAIPIAIVINGVRVFLTGFLVYFVNPALGEGFMHATEGWLLFLVSLASLAAVAGLGVLAERRFFRDRALA
jgi:exosortase